MQLSEHDPVHVMWQVELPLQVTLELAPTVAVQVELPVQSTLQESRHAPEQFVWFEQAREQLPASPPQLFDVNAQLVPELHEHDAPEHVGGGVDDELPQAARAVAVTMMVTMTAERRRMFDYREVSDRRGCA